MKKKNKKISRQNNNEIYSQPKLPTKDPGREHRVENYLGRKMADN